jgi:hypothetical protein
MASPKVFISSTCFDLREIRDSLSRFIESFGFEPVLSEHGDVFYHPDLHTHESCVHEISNCQLFILIIGGRFGGSYTKDKTKSITNAEYEAARECKIPIFSYVQKNVLENHHSYLANKDKAFISEFEFTAIEKQEHAIDIFKFIDSVRKAKINNAFESFETSNDIESHLRKQFAGMFFDFLKNREVREQIDVAKVMISALQTSGEKMEELVKGLYQSTETNKNDEIIESIDEKYAAIEFFKLVLLASDSDINAYLGEYDELDTLALVEPNNLSWFEFLVELKCFQMSTMATFYNDNDNDGDDKLSIDFCGPGFSTNEFGFYFDGKSHLDKEKFYNIGVKKLSLEQRKEVIGKFVTSREKF